MIKHKNTIDEFPTNAQVRDYFYDFVGRNNIVSVTEEILIDFVNYLIAIETELKAIELTTGEWNADLYQLSNLITAFQSGEWNLIDLADMEVIKYVETDIAYTYTVIGRH